MKLGDLLRARTIDASDKAVKEEVSKLFKRAYLEAEKNADNRNRTATISINTVEYDNDCPMFDYSFNSPLLIDKIIPEVIRKFQNEGITAKLEDSPKGLIKHWILRLSW